MFPFEDEDGEFILYKKRRNHIEQKKKWDEYVTQVSGNFKRMYIMSLTSYVVLVNLLYPYMHENSS